MLDSKKRPKKIISMKNHTIISPPHTPQQRSYYQYMKVFFLGLTALFVIIEVYQFYKFFSIRSRYISLMKKQGEETLAGTTIESLTKELQQLEDRQQLLTAELMWPDNYLRVIAELIPVDVRLTFFGCSSDKPLCLKGTSKTYQALHQFVDALKHRSTFKAVHIDSISYDAIKQETQFQLFIDV